jgi:hypothetical protein
MIVQIPLENVINQTLSVVLNNQSITLELYTNDCEYEGEIIHRKLLTNIYLNGILIYANVPCNNSQNLNQYNSDLIGYLYFYDSEDQEPDYNNFGKTCFLLWSDTNQWH